MEEQQSIVLEDRTITTSSADTQTNRDMNESSTIDTQMELRHITINQQCPMEEMIQEKTYRQNVLQKQQELLDSLTYLEREITMYEDQVNRWLWTICPTTTKNAADQTEAIQLRVSNLWLEKKKALRSATNNLKIGLIRSRQALRLESVELRTISQYSEVLLQPIEKTLEDHVLHVQNFKDSWKLESQMMKDLDEQQEKVDNAIVPNSDNIMCCEEHVDLSSINVDKQHSESSISEIDEEEEGERGWHVEKIGWLCEEFCKIGHHIFTINTDDKEEKETQELFESFVAELSSMSFKMFERTQPISFIDMKDNSYLRNFWIIAAKGAYEERWQFHDNWLSTMNMTDKQRSEWFKLIDDVKRDHYPIVQRLEIFQRFLEYVEHTIVDNVYRDAMHWLDMDKYPNREIDADGNAYE